MASRHGRNLHQRNASAHTAATQERDVPLECRNRRITRGLARRKEIPDLAEQVVADANESLGVGAVGPSDRLGSLSQQHVACAVLRSKANSFSIDGNAFTFPGDGGL